MISRRNLLYFLLAGGIALPPGFAHAEDERDGSKDDDGGSDHESDDTGGDDGSGTDEEKGGAEQDRALDAVKKDHAASLKEILTIVRKQYDGEIVHVSLSGSVPNLIYHIKLLDSGDRLIDVQIDALSRQIVHIEGT